MIINRNFYPGCVAPTHHLGMVTDIATKYRRTLPVKFDSGLVGLQSFYKDFLMSNLQINDFFIDIFFDNKNFFDKTQPKYGNGKVIESTVDVIKILKLQKESAVFLVSIDKKYNVVMKCSRLEIDAYYGRDRFLFNKFKTIIEREAASFKIVDEIEAIKDDFVRLYAHGNLWAYKDSKLFACLEVILIQYIPTESILDETWRLILTLNNEKQAYVLFAETFKYLYRLHANNIVHGDPHTGNILRKGASSSKLCWIDLERLQKRESYFSEITWNTLKLIDIHVLLNIIMMHYYLDFRFLNLREFRKKLPLDYKNAFLPHESFRHGGVIHDDSSCNAMNEIFTEYVDRQFISNPNMSNSTFLVTFTDPDKLKHFIDTCRRAIVGVPNETVVFPVDKYTNHPLPEKHPDATSGSGGVVQQKTTRESQTKVTPKDVQQESITKPEQHGPKLEPILEGTPYPLNLNGNDMCTEKGDMLYYFMKGKKIYVSPYDQKTRTWVENYFLKQLYTIKDGKVTALCVDKDKICFYEVVGDHLDVKYFVNSSFKIHDTYDLQYTSPMCLKLSTPAVSNQQNTESIDPVINSSQKTANPVPTAESSAPPEKSANTSPIQINKPYKLILNNNQIYSSSKIKQYYFKDKSGNYDVAHSVNGDWQFDQTQQLFYMKNGAVIPVFIKDITPICFYKIRGHFLDVVYTSNDNFTQINTWSSYDLNHNPPLRIENKKIVSVTPEEHSNSKNRQNSIKTNQQKPTAESTPDLKDLVINGEQYYSLEGKYQIFHENGKYVLCDVIGKSVTRLAATYYHPLLVYSNESRKYDFIYDSIPGTLFSSSKGVLMIKLNSNGILDIDIVAGSTTKHKYTYDIKTNPARYVLKE